VTCSEAQKIEIEKTIKILEAYYGPYNTENEDVEFFSIALSKYASKDYKKLISNIFDTHPKKYGCPDIAALFKASNHPDNSVSKMTVPQSEYSEEKWEPKSKEEKNRAKEAHDNFLKFAEDNLKVKNVKKKKTACVNCQFVPKPGASPTYECRGCIDFSNFKEIGTS